MSDEAATSEILYLVGFTPDAGYDDVLNRWYDEEHIPELLACPGFLSIERYELVGGDSDSPQYLAAWRLAGMDAFQSPEYLALQQRTPDQLTPLARETADHRTRDFWAQYRQISTTSASE
jgi:hypothetical protein